MIRYMKPLDVGDKKSKIPKTGFCLFMDKWIPKMAIVGRGFDPKNIVSSAKVRIRNN